MRNDAYDDAMSAIKAVENISAKCIAVIGGAIVAAILSYFALREWAALVFNQSPCQLVAWSLVAAFLGASTASFFVSIVLKKKIKRIVESKDAEIERLKREAHGNRCESEKPEPMGKYGLNANFEGLKLVSAPVARMVVASMDRSWKPQPIEDEEEFDRLTTACKGVVRRNLIPPIHGGKPDGNYSVFQQWVDFLDSSPKAVSKLRRIAEGDGSK